MRAPLAVRVNDGAADLHVTAHARNLRFTKTAPGGHHSASMRLLLPRDTFDDLGPADRVYIYDARTGRTAWEGYTENPGSSDGPAGQEFDLSAMGGVVLAGDKSQPLVYVDRDLGAWQQHHATLPAYQAGAGSTPNVEGDTALVFQFPRGIATSTGHRVTLEYPALKEAGLSLGGFAYDVVAGIIDANYTTDALAVGAAGTEVVRTTAASTSSHTVNPVSAGGTGGFTVGQDMMRLRFIRGAGGATNIANDNTWASVTNLWLMMLRYRIDGTAVSGTGAYPTGTILASQVAADLVGRGVIGTIDHVASRIETSTHPIDQLAYLDGARAAQVLDDLALWEPDFLWEILHSTAAGHVFNFRAWPTTPRYEISVKDGYSAPGGDVDLCNRITVYWTDKKGKARTTVVTSTVPELGTRTRDAESVTLPEGLGSAANAQRLGEQVLAQKSAPPKASRAVVRRPIVDYLTGATVMPWEIEPGYLVRVRELGEDLRLTEMEYDDESCSASLTLGEPTKTMDQLLAGVGR